MLRKLAMIGIGAITVSVGAPMASAMNFVFNNDSTNPANASMVAGFAQAGGLWSSKFSDPITIVVTVKSVASLPPQGGGTPIGFTSAFFDPYDYSSVKAKMLLDSRTADDALAYSKLQAGSTFGMLINRTANNPNGALSATPYFDTGLGGSGQAGPENNSTVRITSANAKALGIYPGGATDADGAITFSNAITYDYDRSNGITGGQVDFVGVATHELGHLLGFLSGVDTLEGNTTAPGKNDNQLKFVTPIDLFRFSSRSIVAGAGGGVGVIDWTTDNAVAKYFSVDGGTSAIANFSTGATFGDGFEASHWKNSASPLGIMDPTAGGGELLAISDNDLRAFDVMGYDLPEPSTAGAMALSTMGSGFLRRKRKVGRTTSGR